MIKNKLLISTMLNLIYYDGQSYHIIDSGDLSKGDAHYTGITWGDSCTFYVAGCRKTVYGFYTFDKNSFSKIEFLQFLNLHETYQIFYQDQRWYFVNTGLNRIEILWNCGEIQKVFFGEESTCDIDHLNSIWSDGEKFYISEFRHKKEEPSVVRICDLDFNLLETIEIGLPIHNVYVENDRIINLVSRQAGIYTTHLKLGYKSFLSLPELQGMLLRGLARTESKWYIGASRWEPDRQKRVIGDGIVLALDNNFKRIDRIVMPNVGPVCDIRVIDEIDLAHNRVPFYQ